MGSAQDLGTAGNQVQEEGARGARKASISARGLLWDLRPRTNVPWIDCQRRRRDKDQDPCPSALSQPGNHGFTLHGPVLRSGGWEAYTRMTPAPRERDESFRMNINPTKHTRLVKEAQVLQGRLGVCVLAWGGWEREKQLQKMW